MKELAEYRTNLVQKLEDSAKSFHDECLQVNDPYAPADADGWTVHQIAIHTRDVDELIYGLRARRTAVEDNPEFPNFDGEAYMKAHYDSGEPLEHVLSSLVGNARAFLIATIAAGLGPSWLASALWIWAPLVALARVAMGVHYLSDIVAGAVFGVFVAWIGLQVYPPLFDWMFGLLGFTLW